SSGIHCVVVDTCCWDTTIPLDTDPVSIGPKKALSAHPSLSHTLQTLFSSYHRHSSHLHLLLSLPLFGTYPKSLAIDSYVHRIPSRRRRKIDTMMVLNHQVMGHDYGIQASDVAIIIATNQFECPLEGRYIKNPIGCCSLTISTSNRFASLWRGSMPPWIKL
ncbi:hypothetical protein M8C21_011905, partial [Ambrosia artemisiifolia]